MNPREVLYSDFSIFGVKLRDHKEDYLKLLKNDPDEIAKRAERLETWVWEKDRSHLLQTPLRIDWVDGRVSQISGAQLTYLEASFKKSSSLDEIRDCIPNLIFTERLFKGLRFENSNFRLSIMVVPGENQFLLSDLNLGAKWAEIMFPILNPHVSETRTSIDPEH